MSLERYTRRQQGKWLTRKSLTETGVKFSKTRCHITKIPLSIVHWSSRCVVVLVCVALFCVFLSPGVIYIINRFILQVRNTGSRWQSIKSLQGLNSVAGSGMCCRSIKQCVLCLFPLLVHPPSPSPPHPLSCRWEAPAVSPFGQLDLLVACRMNAP